MSNDATRTEKDSMGDVEVPAGRYYGAQTQRAVDNFPVSGLAMPGRFVHALGLVKWAAARANTALGLLDAPIGDAIAAAALEVAEGQWDGEFVVDVFQTGSGTSTNMNANEVVANLAIERLGGRLGSKDPVHPNDHVNLGQSSNDVIPTALHVAAAGAIVTELLPAIDGLRASLERKAIEFAGIVKIGRTHLMDAVPMTLGQEFSGWEAQVAHGLTRVSGSLPGLLELAIGGTAVGTGLNAHPEFAPRVVSALRERTGLEFREAENRFEALAARDAAVHASGCLRGLAVALTKIATDLRLLASGPRCGIAEIVLPALQPGSSIMPGKVNPVVPEMVAQVAARVVGNDATIALAGASGFLELHTMMPLVAYDLLQSISILGSASRLLAERCVDGIAADPVRAAALIEGSLAMVTALAPRIGYDAAAKIARESWETGRTVREVARAHRVLPDRELDEALDPLRMAHPEGRR